MLYFLINFILIVFMQDDYAPNLEGCHHWGTRLVAGPLFHNDSDISRLRFRSSDETTVHLPSSEFYTSGVLLGPRIKDPIIFPEVI